MLDTSGTEQELHRLRTQLRKRTQELNLLRLKAFSMQRAILHLSGEVAAPHDHPLAELTPIETRLQPGATTTIFAFGGLRTQLGIPPKEFFRSFEDKPVNVLFVKDFQQCWYMQGLLGASRDLASTAQVLRDLTPAGTERIRTIGNSAGGFAAIHFGLALGADRVLAFGPQTTVSPEDFKHFAATDSRIEEMDFDDGSLDLAQTLARYPDFSGRIDLYYSDRFPRDAAHAARIADFPSVETHACPHDRHGVAAWLKEQGRLDGVLSAFATGD